MTTPQPNIFNPASGSANIKSASQKQNKVTEYPTTGNMTRDQVRKMLYNAFMEDNQIDDAKISISDMVD